MTYTWNNDIATRQLQARQAAAKGDVLLRIPLSCQLRYDHLPEPALNSLFERVPVGSDSGKSAWQFKQALLLLWHHLQGEASPLHPYLAVLPGLARGLAVPHVGLNLSDEAVQQLQYVPLMQDIHNHKYWLQQWSDSVLPSLPSSADNPFRAAQPSAQQLGWALSVVLSRSFGLKRTPPAHVLVPLVDLADHEPRTCNVEMRTAGDVVEMVATQQVAAGSPLLLNYGPIDNPNLLLSYGFVIPNNPYDKYLVAWDTPLVLQVVSQLLNLGDEGLRLAPWQQQKLQDLGLGPAQPQGDQEGGSVSYVEVGGSPPVSWRCLAAMRVILLQDDSLVRDMPLEQLGAWGTPIARQHEIIVMKSLVRLLSVMYQGLPTTIQQDKQILAQGQVSDDVALAVRFRLAMKQSWEEVVKKLLARSSELSQLAAPTPV